MESRPFARDKAQVRDLVGQETNKNRDKKVDMEDDIRLLLDCLHFQRDCPSSQRQALTTMATMCAHSSQSRDLFRVTGALSYVRELLYSTSSTHVQQAALYTLGCAMEKNVINQMKLCDDKLFVFLADVLKPHPLPMPIQPTTPALTASIAYVCGCLMSGNAQGQNMAREKRLLHRLIAVFKSNLPKSSPSKPDQPVSHNDAAAVVDSTASLQVWTSVSSALCTANNNPQNEMNQCVCSQLLPAALSLIGGASPLQPDVLRPAVSFITSCIANNGTTQGRLRMIGGLHILVSALKELSSEQQSNELTSRVLLTDLAVHIVQALSAAIFMHAINTDTLCENGVIGHLLRILQWEGLDGHAHLSIVMCLSMLTEDRVSTQSELISCGGLHLLLSLLSEAHCDEELSKAITFVLQCCLPQQHQELNTSNAGDEAVRAGITRVERLLAQGNNPANEGDVSNDPANDNDNVDEKELHDISIASSNQSLTSANALRRIAASKSDPSQKHPINLEHVDSERLPIRTTIANWLMNTDNENHNSTVENEDGRLLAGGACNLSTAITKQNEIIAQDVRDVAKTKPENRANALQNSVKDCGNTRNKHCNVAKKQKANEHCEVDVESVSLCKERELRKELERELEKERAKRMRLEKLVKQARQVEEAKVVQQDKQDKESQTRFEANQDRGHLTKCQSKPVQHRTQDKECQTLVKKYGANQGRGTLVKQPSELVELAKENQTLVANHSANQGRGHLKSNQSHQIAVSTSTKVPISSQPKSKPKYTATQDDNKENMDPNLRPIFSKSQAPYDTKSLKSFSDVRTTPVNAANPSNIRYASSSTNVHQNNNLKTLGHHSKMNAPKTCSYVSMSSRLSQQVTKGTSHVIKGADVERGNSCQQLCHLSASERADDVIMKGALMEKGRNCQHLCQSRTNEKSLDVTRHQKMPKIDEEDAPIRQQDPIAMKNAELSSNSDTRQQVSTDNEEDTPTRQRDTPTYAETANLNTHSQSASTTCQCIDQGHMTLTHRHMTLTHSSKQQSLTQYKPPHSGLSSNCEHQCLACKPRLKCATVTSRNFNRMIQLDRFTCAYHKSLIQRLTTTSNTASRCAKDTICCVGTEMKSVCLTTDCECENLSSQPKRVLPVQCSSVCMSLNVHSDSVCREKGLSHCGGACTSQNEYLPQQKSNLSELDHSSQSDVSLKRKAPWQYGGTSAGKNLHSESGSDSNVGGCCFCTVSNNAATPVKKRRVDGECKGQDGHVQVARNVDEDDCLVHCDGLSSVSERDDFAESLQYLKKQGPLHCGRDANHQPDCRVHPSQNQPKTRQLIDSSSSSSADSALQQIPEHQNRDDSFSQNSEESEAISHSSDPNWTPSGQISSQSTGNSLCGAGDVPNESMRTKNSKCTSGNTQDVHKNTGISTSIRKSHQSVRATTKTSKPPDSAPSTVQWSQRMRPHVQYHLVAQPKKGKKATSKATSTFGALIDVTNKGTVVGGAKGEWPVKKRQPSCALTVFDYQTPEKPAGSKCRSNATGQLHTAVHSRYKTRVSWSKAEEENLLKGVERLGHRWSHILSAYEFHHSRDSMSLRDKYRNLQKHFIRD